MQIHEVTKINETPISDLIYGGLARAMSGSQQDPTKLAASSQAKIADIAKRALPSWQAKQTQISQTMGTANFDEELEAWLEQNILQNRLHVEDLDPAYTSQIKNIIKAVNAIPDTDVDRKRNEFTKLIATTLLARPARQNVGRVAAKANVQAVITSALAAIEGGANMSSQQVRALGNGYKAQGITAIPRTTIMDLAGPNAQGVQTLLSAMGLTIT